MEKLLYKFYLRFGITSNRTRNITMHALLSFLYKGGSILASFLLVPLMINYLDTESYGIWLTLSSFITWFSFFDIGLGNGFRNKFAEAKAKGDMTLAKGYVSSAYFTIGAVSFGLIVTFTLLNFFIDWTKVFKASPTLQKDLSLIMPIVFGFFCLQLVVKLITTIYTADQHHSMQGKINFYTQAGSLLLIWVMTKTNEGSLFVCSIIFSIFPVLILVCLNWFAFKKRYQDFKPSLHLWKKEYLKDIFGLGILFFIVQISGVILYSTDNFMIARMFSPAEVVPYNIVYKYMSIATMTFSIIAAPYWSSITDAYNRNDLKWIKNAMRGLQRISLFFILMIVLMALVSKPVYCFWVGPSVFIDKNLTIWMGVFFSFSIYATPYTVFLNGTGKVKIQAIQSLVVAILNIPLSLFLVKLFNFGTDGIILATIICFIPSLLLSRIQYLKLINEQANGVWNK